MSNAVQERERAATLPEGDVIRILLEQHAQVRDLFADIESSGGQLKKERFDQLRALLAVHETGEEIVLRPVSVEIVGEAVVDSRNEEEAEANEVLKHLESLDVDDPAFDVALKVFKTAVGEHAEKEETEEFEAVIAACDPERRKQLGTRLRVVEALAPTHPHPAVAGSTAAQILTGPFASMVDRVRDALGV
ncbi:MAG: hemerythrin protein [Marmoricola sp.]|nr:hemerythrin protein [Marmoricola sp.]